MPMSLLCRPEGLHYYCEMLLREMCALGLDVHRIERLAGGHEQAVAARAAEADVGARLGQADHPDARAVGGDDLDAGPRATPDVAVHVAADAVGGRRRARSGDVELDEPLAASQRLAIDVVDADVAAR